LSPATGGGGGRGRAGRLPAAAAAGLGLLACLATLAGAGEPPLSPADEKYRTAGALFGRGEFARAAAEYAAFATRFRSDPRAAEAFFRSAESLYRAGESQRARAAFERCLKLGLPPARLAAAEVRIGAIKYAAGDAAGAAQVLAAASLKDLPVETRRAAEYFLGAALLELGRKAEARPHLEAAGASASAAVAAPALLELARLGDGAARHLEDLLKRFPRSPEAPEAGFRLAEMLRVEGKAKRALTLYAEVLKRSPPGELAARAALGAAWAHLQAGTAAEAVRLAELAAGLPALRTEATYVRGLALTGAGQHAEAEAAFASIIESDPASPRAEGAACRLVWCRHLAGKHAMVGLAAREFRARFPKSPRASEVAYVEGLAAAAGGDREGALAALDRAAADPRARYAAESTYRAALLCLELGRAEEGRKRLELVVEKHPGHALADPALVRLGELALEADDPKRAAARFEKQLAAFPTSRLRPAALLGRALCSAATGEWADFRSRCEKLAAGGSGKAHAAEAAYWLAWSHERTKSYDRAIRAYQALIAKHKRSPLIYEFKYRLCCAYYLNANFPKAAEGFLALARSGRRALPAEALLWLGRYLATQNRGKEASEVYALAAASTNPATRAEARLALGRQALAEGRAAEAARIYEQLLADAPGWSRADEARLELARALREAGRPAEARKLAAGLCAAKDERTRILARGEVGLADLAAGDAAVAVRALEPLAILYDESEAGPRWLEGLALAAGKLGRGERATGWYRELIERYPASPEAAAASKKTGIPLPKRPPKAGEDF
jgi:TolA-binding protein